MAKIAVIDDYESHALIFSAPLILAGHEVQLAVHPIDWEKVIRFGPEVISLILYRKKIAFNRPIRDFPADVLGYAALQDMVRYPAIQVVPILLVGNALEEADVPKTLDYDLFLSFPEDIALYLPKLEELAHTVKTRRKLSGYVCPLCRSRMVFFDDRDKDLFCPRCGTALAIVDYDYCTYLTSGGLQAECTIDQITPPNISNSA